MAGDLSNFTPKGSLNSDEFYESYEDLFDGEGSKSGPCYLPDRYTTQQQPTCYSDEDSVGENEDPKSPSVHEDPSAENSAFAAGDDVVDENGGRRNKEEVSEILEADDGRNPGYVSSSGGYEPGSSSCNSGSSSSLSSESSALGHNADDEGDTSVKWRKRRKHFFIISNSGKPIYSRYGDENKLAGFSATLQAIISFMETSGDKIRRAQAGKHQIAFMMKGPIHLVCISCTEEPFQVLLQQLELLYAQMLLILTKSIEKYFKKNAKFDMRPLLGGTNAVFASLIHSFSWSPAVFLQAYTCMALPISARQAATATLQDVIDSQSQVIFAVLMCKNKVISIAGAQKASLHPRDLLLLSNFITSSESFRTSEAFSPICIPKYNSTAFLHAYVHYIEDDVFLVLLTANPNGFYHLKESRIQIETALQKADVLNEVKKSQSAGLHVESLHDYQIQEGEPSTRSTTTTERVNTSVGGPAGLWHFIYKNSTLNQYVSSEFSSSLCSYRAQKSLLRAYQRLYASMHDDAVGPHKMQYRRDENYILFCWVTIDFELYAAFDPLAERNAAIAACNRVCQWLRDVDNEIFFLDVSPNLW